LALTNFAYIFKAQRLEEPGALCLILKSEKNEFSFSKKLSQAIRRPNPLA
jgi:hypothetical protein